MEYLANSHSMFHTWLIRLLHAQISHHQLSGWHDIFHYVSTKCCTEQSGKKYSYIIITCRSDGYTRFSSLEKENGKNWIKFASCKSLANKYIPIRNSISFWPISLQANPGFCTACLLSCGCMHEILLPRIAFTSSNQIAAAYDTDIPPAATVNRRQPSKRQHKSLRL